MYTYDNGQGSLYKELYIPFIQFVYKELYIPLLTIWNCYPF